MTELVLATRASPLALWQAEQVAARLRDTHEGLSVRLLEVRTHGDRVQDKALNEMSGVGLFTKEVDARVLGGDAHAAVHSLKDQLTTLPEGLCLGMVLTRGPVEDALVTSDGRDLEGLGPGERVATGSLRRRAQLLRWRPDLSVVSIRGNVDGRIAQIDAGAAEAVVLARAGLVRLGLEDRISQVLPPQRMLPAVSQGIVGVTCRAEDGVTRERLAAADDANTRTAARAERAFLGTLGGGCNVPAGAWARCPEGKVVLTARVLDRDGRRMLERHEEGPAELAEDLGSKVANALLEEGAAALLQDLRS